MKQAVGPSPRRKAAPPRPGGLEQYAAVFAALSEPVRMEMVRLISSVEELPCTALAERLPISKSTISYHVKVLYHAGLIAVRKDGRNYHYKLLRPMFEAYLPGFLPKVQGSRRVDVGAGRVHRSAAAVA